MNILVVDDETLARNRLRTLLADAEAWEMVTFEDVAVTSPIPFLDGQWATA